MGEATVSTEEQTKGDGFPRQRQAILDYARKNDIEVIQIFEEDVSGAAEGVQAYKNDDDPFYSPPRAPTRFYSSQNTPIPTRQREIEDLFRSPRYYPHGLTLQCRADTGLRI